VSDRSQEGVELVVAESIDPRLRLVRVFVVHRMTATHDSIMVLNWHLVTHPDAKFWSPLADHVPDLRVSLSGRWSLRSIVLHAPLILPPVLTCCWIATANAILGSGELTLVSSPCFFKRIRDGGLTSQACILMISIEQSVFEVLMHAHGVITVSIATRRPLMHLPERIPAGRLGKALTHPRSTRTVPIVEPMLRRAGWLYVPEVVLIQKSVGLATLLLMLCVWG
jgi:hypothetical protein